MDPVFDAGGQTEGLDGAEPLNVFEHMLGTGRARGVAQPDERANVAASRMVNSASSCSWSASVRVLVNVALQPSLRVPLDSRTYFVRSRATRRVKLDAQLAPASATLTCDPPRQ